VLTERKTARNGGPSNQRWNRTVWLFTLPRCQFRLFLWPVRQTANTCKNRTSFVTYLNSLNQTY